ncbi:MAG: Clp1/GlmU family protein [Methylohalobius sp.]
MEQRIDIPGDWRRAASLILERGLCKILVLGASDRGKSTFCSYLAWHLLRAGLQPALIDADVGQKDLGPPATITLGYPRLNQALQDLRPAALYFVGAVSPLAHLLPMVVGTRQLLEQVDAPFVIINTSGLITGVGEVLKSYKIDSVRPDVLVALAKDQELNPILAAHRHFRILRLAPSPKAQSKPMEVRRQRRLEAFRRYFSRAQEYSLALDELIFQRLPVQGFENLAQLLTPNRLCALADERQTVLGLALVRSCDLKRRSLSVWSPVTGKKVRIVQLGDIHLELKGPER